LEEQEKRGEERRREEKKEQEQEEQEEQEEQGAGSREQGGTEYVKKIIPTVTFPPPFFSFLSFFLQPALQGGSCAGGRTFEGLLTRTPHWELHTLSLSERNLAFLVGQPRNVVKSREVQGGTRDQDCVEDQVQAGGEGHQRIDT